MALSVNNGSAFVKAANSSSLNKLMAPLLGDGVAIASSTRAGLTATASATPHTAGSWVELSPGLSAAAAGLYFRIQADTNVSGGNSSTLLEIGTGASGAEVAWATVGVGYIAGLTRDVVVPGFIAAGTRVAIRCRSAVVSQVVTVIPTGISVIGEPPPAPTTYQANTATSRGLTVTAPGSLNTKGAWVELVASTSVGHSFLCVTPQGAGGTTMSATGVLIDIGIGGSGSEVVLIPDMNLAGTTTESYSARTPLTYAVSVPAGSRLAARYARANSGNAIDLVVVAA